MGCERFLPNLNNSSRQDAKTQSFELEQFKIRNIFFKYFLIYQNFSINLTRPKKSLQISN